MDMLALFRHPEHEAAPLRSTIITA